MRAQNLQHAETKKLKYSEAKSRIQCRPTECIHLWERHASDDVHTPLVAPCIQ